MRLATLLACLALLFAGTPANAGQADADTLDALIAETTAAYDAGDMETYEAGKAELYAAYLDPATPDACRGWIDYMLLAMTLFEAGQERPDSEILVSVFMATVTALPARRNDCLLAI